MRQLAQQAVVRKTKCGMKQAMRILDKSEGAIRKGIERGQIPHRRMGRSIFFFEEELFALFDSAPGLTLDEVRQRQKGGQV